MARRGDCPGTTRIDKGSVYAEGAGNSARAALAQMRTRIQAAKRRAEQDGQAAFRAAVQRGNDGCNPGGPPCPGKACEAAYDWTVSERYSTAVINLPPDPNWTARGYWTWRVFVTCRCPEEVLAAIAIDFDEEPGKGEMKPS
jgi:hypothetical protein